MPHAMRDAMAKLGMDRYVQAHKLNEAKKAYAAAISRHNYRMAGIINERIRELERGL